MGDIHRYIKRNPVLKRMDFLVVYLTIVELVKDGQIELKYYV